MQLNKIKNKINEFIINILRFPPRVAPVSAPISLKKVKSYRFRSCVSVKVGRGKTGALGSWGLTRGKGWGGVCCTGMGGWEMGGIGRSEEGGVPEGEMGAVGKPAVGTEISGGSLMGTLIGAESRMGGIGELEGAEVCCTGN